MLTVLFHHFSPSRSLLLTSAVIARIINPAAELIIPIGMQKWKMKTEMETETEINPVTTEVKKKLVLDII